VIERAGWGRNANGWKIVGRYCWFAEFKSRSCTVTVTRFGAGVARPSFVVLHTQAFKDITVREVVDAVLKCVRQDTIKCVQQVPGPRYRLTFRSLEYKQLFLDQPFHLRGERDIAQELDMPTLLAKVLYAPSEISNQTIAATLAKYGKIVKVDREMYRDWPNVETGVRLATMSELTEGIALRGLALIR
jgi:hypothetical protein